MSPGLSIELHWWRGIGPEVQHNLFFYGFRLGFVSISICRVCVLDSYRQLRVTLVNRVADDDAARHGEIT